MDDSSAVTDAPNITMMEQEEPSHALEDDGEDHYIQDGDAIEVPVDDAAPAEDDDDDALMQETNDSSQQEEQSRYQFQSHTGPVYAVAVAASDRDSLVLVSGGGDDQAFLHTTTVNGGSSQRLEHSHTDSVSSVAMTTDWIAVGSYDGSIVLYSRATTTAADDGLVLSPTHVLDGPTDIEWLSFHPSGTVILAGSTDGTVWMYHITTTTTTAPQCLQVLVGHAASVTAGAFVGTNSIATASADGTVRLWAPKTGLVKHVFRLSDGTNDTNVAGLTCLQPRTADKLILVGSEDGCAYICHAGPTKKVLHRLEHTAAPQQNPGMDDDDTSDAGTAVSVEAVGWCPVEHPWCATAGVDGVLKIWDVTTGQCRHVCRVVPSNTGDTSDDDDEGITRLVWYKVWVITASTMGTIRIWDTRSGELVQTLTSGNCSVVNDLQVCLIGNNEAGPEQLQIVTGSDDHVVRVFLVDQHDLSSRD